MTLKVSLLTFFVGNLTTHVAIIKTGEASQKEIDVLMKTLDVNLNGQINLVEYAPRAKEFVKKRILLTFLLRMKARGK